MSNQSLKGQTAVVTGAANGIGRAIAERLGLAGANVVVADLDADAAAAVATNIPGSIAIGCDVTDEAQVQGLIENSVDHFGGLHIMVPNAGIAHVSPIVDMDLATWRRVTAVNLDGVFLSLRYAAPAIIGSGGGSIVTIGSVTATAGSPLVAHYAASKAAVVNLTKTAAIELRDHNVRVNCVLPGFVETALVAGSVDPFESALGLPAGGFAALIGQKQTRFGTPDEVADAVLFFASDDSRFCNGSGLVLDGGLVASLF